MILLVDAFWIRSGGETTGTATNPSLVILWNENRDETNKSFPIKAYSGISGLIFPLGQGDLFMRMVDMDSTDISLFCTRSKVARCILRYHTKNTFACMMQWKKDFFGSIL